MERIESIGKASSIAFPNLPAFGRPYATNPDGRSLFIYSEIPRSSTFLSRYLRTSRNIADFITPPIAKCAVFVTLKELKVFSYTDSSQHERNNLMEMKANSSNFPCNSLD